MKLEVIENAEKISIIHASGKFKIDRKRIREWMKQKGAINNKLQTTTEGDKKKRLDGEGRKIVDNEVENPIIVLRVDSQSTWS